MSRPGDEQDPQEFKFNRALLENTMLKKQLPWSPPSAKAGINLGTWSLVPKRQRLPAREAEEM